MITSKTQNVLQICVHYDDIINYPFKENDILTKVILDEYENKIFEVDSQDYGKTNHLKVIDIVVYEYLTDTKFMNSMRNTLAFEGVSIDEESLLNYDIISTLIKVYRNYRERNENKKEDTLWL